MKCPYRKVIYHHQAEQSYCSTRCAYDEEGFAECYGKECPNYDNGFCRRVFKEGKKGGTE